MLFSEVDYDCSCLRNASHCSYFAVYRQALGWLGSQYSKYKSLFWDLGEALLDEKHFELSISVFNKLEAFEQSNTGLLLRRGTAYKELGQLNKAKLDLEKAVELSHGMVEVGSWRSTWKGSDTDKPRAQNFTMFPSPRRQCSLWSCIPK